MKRLKRDYAVSDEQIIADINKVEMYIVLNVAANSCLLYTSRCV